MNTRRSRLRSVVVTVAAIAGITATALLGQWQLSRAAQKQAIYQATLQREVLPVLDNRALAAAMGAIPAGPATGPATTPAVPTAGAKAGAAPAAVPPELVHRRVLLRGHWLPRYTLYLDNRQMEGRQGFYVATPLQLEGGPAVLVQRGWVPRNFEDRTHLEPVETPAGEVEVAGDIAAAPGRLYEFTSGAPAEGSSPIRQNLDLAAYRRETGLPLAALSVQQTGAASEGLLRKWPPITAGVEMNYGYAFQWFGLCALIVILYVWFNLIRRRRAPAAA